MWCHHAKLLKLSKIYMQMAARTALVVFAVSP